MCQPLQNSLNHVSDLVALWNRSSLEPFLVDTRLMGEYLQSPGTLVLTHGKPWQGVLWARNGKLGTTLDAVMVLPDARRRGVGRSLVETFRHSLEPSVAWRFGGGSHHFVPGLPDQMGQASNFFLALGLVADWHAHDLIWRAPSSSTATEWDATTFRLVTALETGDLRRLLEEFGRRWQDDTELRCQALRAGHPEEIMGAYQQDRLVGFCHIWTPRSQTLGPSTFWLSREDEKWGGIGPLGVHPDQRGFGLGAGVVESSMAYLRAKGAQRIGVDWTGLPKFYQRCGFELWLSYRGYQPG